MEYVRRNRNTFGKTLRSRLLIPVGHFSQVFTATFNLIIIIEIRFLLNSFDKPALKEVLKLQKCLAIQKMILQLK